MMHIPLFQELGRDRQPSAFRRQKRELWKCGACGKRGKPKTGFPLFPRAPWKSRQKAARFPHSQQLRRRRRMEKWKTKSRFPLSHRLDSSLIRRRPLRGRASPSARAALRAASVVSFCSAGMGNFHSALDKARRLVDERGDEYSKIVVYCDVPANDPIRLLLEAA